MKRVLILALLLTVPAALARAQDEAVAEPTQKEKIQALEQEYTDAMAEFSKLYRAAETKEAKNKLYETSYPDAAKYAPRFILAAESAPETPAAAKALAWVVQNAGRAKEPTDTALALLQKHHIESIELGGVCRSLTYSSSDAAKTFLRHAVKSSPHKKVQGTACFSLGMVLKRSIAKAGPDGAVIEKEAEGCFQRVIKEFGDVIHYREKTLGESAKGNLYEMRNLAIGKEAPEIAAQDIAGVAFKLSDYRGKVVMLDFWGHW